MCMGGGPKPPAAPPPLPPPPPVPTEVSEEDRAARAGQREKAKAAYGHSKTIATDPGVLESTEDSYQTGKQKLG